VAVLIVEVADEFDLVTPPVFVLQRQILVADKVFFLQVSKGRAAGFFIFEQPDFPQFFAQQFLVPVAQ